MALTFPDQQGRQETKKNAQTCANVTGPLACSLEKTPDAGACRQSMHREIKHSVNRSSTQAYREADLRKRRRFQVLVHHGEEHIIQHLGSVVRAPMYLRQKQVSLSNRRWCRLSGTGVQKLLGRQNRQAHLPDDVATNKTVATHS